MTRLFALPVLLALAAPAMAEEARMTRPIEAVSLHGGALDMVAFFMPAGEALEVSATYAPADLTGSPHRVVMALGPNDETTFSLPGYPELTYRFAREGGAVTVRVTGPARTELAAK